MAIKMIWSKQKYTNDSFLKGIKVGNIVTVKAKVSGNFATTHFGNCSNNEEPKGVYEGRGVIISYGKTNCNIEEIDEKRNNNKHKINRC